MGQRSLKIPISIHPFFWIFAALIGYFMSQSLIGTVIWVVVIFISVLFHECGHALMALLFKQHPRIQLIALGGMTSYEGKNLKFWQQFLIVLNGPLFGFILFGLATLILWLNFLQSPVIVTTIRYIQLVNLFWTIVNLVPVLPLDGGQLLRIALEAAFGVKGFKISIFIGMLISAALAMTFFAMRQYFLGALFFLFAFQSFDLYRRTKNLTVSDRDEKIADKLKQAEILLKSNKKEEAKLQFEEIRKISKDGILFVTATHYLALINFEMGNKHVAYEMLLSVKDKLAEDAMCLLHELAFDEKNYQLVVKLSANCYKLSPSRDVALRNARSFGVLDEAKSAGGWLKTAKQFGEMDLEKVIHEDFFKTVKDQDVFKHFFNNK